MAKESKPRASKKDAAAGTKSKKAAKDPNAPKRPLSAYMIFSQAHRASVKEENPDASFGQLLALSRVVLIEYLMTELQLLTGDLGKLLGAKWKEMGDDEKKVSGWRPGSRLVLGRARDASFNLAIPMSPPRTRDRT